MSSLRGGFVRRLSILIVAVLVGLSVVGFLVTRSANQGQERRLLLERAGEVGAFLTVAISSATTALGLLGEDYTVERGAGPAFVANARSLLQQPVISVGILQSEGDAIVVRAAEGQGVTQGERLSGVRSDIARRALAAKNLVSGLIQIPSTTRFDLIFAFGRADGLVAFQDTVVDPAQPPPQTPNSPFHDLNVVVYATPVARPDQVIVTTTKSLPLRGAADRRTLAVGADRWLLVTSAKGRLAGSFAGEVPWIILAGGVIGALIAGSIVEVLARRRQFALALVEERTAALRQSMTELESARASAEGANRAKSQFLSRMSHELRTPLNAVLGFGQLLELEELADRERESVDQILKGGNHLLELINEVLDISRIETGEIALSPEPVLVGDLLSDVVDLIRPLAAQRSVHLIGDRHATCGEYVFADRQRFKQVLLNLLSNAVKYNRTGGTVAVSCERRNTTRLQVKVSDTGPGIRPEHLSLLFLPFERLGAERTEVEGTGIGLALSRQLCEAMGGSLEVGSTHGAGSMFWVELPLVEGPVERYERLGGDIPIAQETAPATRRHVVLYIEDNLANLKLVQRVVDRNDIEIIPAMQGRLGLQLARDHQPAIILLDLHLPDLSGEQVLQEFRDDPATATIPVVILSADATPGHIRRLLTAGASAYLTKPINVRELVRVIDDLVTKPDTPPR